MTLRTPRRRISPRTKRRYRAIREFFRRALGSSSQPDLKISSSIALNVTDLKRKIVGLEQQLDEVNRHCKDITCFDCSRQESESCLRSEARNVRESESSNPSEGKHLRELDSCNPSEGKFVRNSNSYILADVKNEIDTIEEQTETSYEKKLNGTETKFLYKSSDGNYIKSEESENICNIQDAIDAKQTQGLLDEYGRHITKVKNKKNKLNRSNDHSAKLHKYKARSVYDNIASANSTSSFRSLAEPRMVRSSSPGYSGPHKDRNYLPEYAEPAPSRTHKDKKYRELMKRNKIELQKEYYEPRPLKARKHKHQNRELDQDFIADIIRRQYKPMKMFDRRQSDLSQISAPICRDQEFPSIREDIQEGTELCSCCYDVTKHKTKYSDLSEMRSICDTRLYSSKKQARGKRRRVPMEVYDNSDLYDLIPVKEKCSPKTRRKFVEDTMIPYEYYREVPPSPRTLRPKLNLKAQYNTEFEDYMTHMKHAAKKGSPHKQRRRRERLEVESDITSVADPQLTKRQLLKTHKNMTCQVENDDLCQRDNATAVSLQYPTYTNDQANATIETAFNKTDEIEMPVDKTDKALCEIKDILQNFLHEIKKETTPSQCDKSEISSKDENCENNNINENSTKITGSRMPNSRHSINYSVGCNQSPYMTPFQNPCCYPMMQMCPMNCPISMQSGFMIPSQSYTCTNCVNASKEPVHSEHCCNKNVTTTGTCHTETCHTETEELIKEIYKFVAQSPNRKKETDWNEAGHVGTKILTSRSVGESSKISKHDAKVGTAPLKCYSKSCEAIGSRNGSEEYNSETNPTYSDTVLEKFSLEVTQSTIDSEMEDIITTEGKDKKKKFSNVLRSFGMFKKKKKDVIEELSESESAVEVPVKPMPPRAPYQQEITNYMMQEPEYYRPPPPMTSYYPRPHEYHPDYHPPYNPGLPEYQPPQAIHDYYGPRMPYPGMVEQASAPPLHPKERPTAPPYHSTYDNPYKPMQQPQVPLCLKEIEVKSIATQSERKMSIFRKIKKKMQLPQLQLQPQPMPQSSDDDNYQKTCSTQTQVAETKFGPVTKPLFNWKKLQAKAMANQSEVDTMKNFTALAQKELADNDLKMRNVMMKKLFNKRNPFSPKNLMVQTLLGRDKNYIEPPVMFKPKLFL
ncbi:uncharacterized protein LOC111352116 [Spodoptera litura]|uniref:Uncharacterized protein LOC111352116 n=1 Tax=Spodoptera litura TaxID=69820 RepID=A0A9J7E2T0_SPOLT|nr:uncharacterized protein LOC111352116 [Spodoptera litura]